MAKKIEELQAKIKELESKLESKNNDPNFSNIDLRNTTQFTVNTSGNIIQYNHQFIEKVSPINSTLEDTEIISNFQKLNHKLLSSLQSIEKDMIDFRTEKDLESKKPLSTKVQKLKQTIDNDDIFHFSEYLTSVAKQINQNQIDILIENSPLAIYKTDANGKCIYVNAKWRAMSGYSQEEAAGDGWINAIYQEDRETIYQFWNQHSQGLVPWNNEYRFQNKKGEVFWVYGTTVAERDQDGNITGYIGNNLDITDQKTTKLKLEESEEKYRQLHKSSGFGVGYFTKDGIIISYNDIAAKNMGGKPEDFAGKSFYQLFPEKDADEYMRRINHSIEHNDLKEYIDKIQVTETTEWYKSVFTNIYNSKNELIGVQIISDNITENKLLENKLKTISNSVENSLNAFDIVDSNGNLIYVNQAYVDIWGYNSAQEIIGMSAAEHCLDPNIPKKIITEVNINGQIEIEFVAKRKDGTTFDVVMNITTDKDHEGNNIYTGTSLDISKSNKNQLELIENEEKFRNFVDYTADGIAIIDNLGKIIFVNKAFCGIFGIQAKETVGLPAWDLMSQMSIGHKESGAHKKEIEKNVLALLLQKENIELEKNYTTVKQAHTNDNKDIVETIFSFDTSTGKRLGIIVRDITEIKKAEEEIISTYKLLQDTEKIGLSGSWTFDPINNTNYWSKGAYDLRGATYETINETDIFKKYLHPNDFEEYYTEFNKNLDSNKTSFYQKFRIVTSQNETKVIEANYEVKRDKKGNPTLIIGIDKDITELNKAEKLLQFQKRISQQYLEVAGVMFLALDTNQNVVLINKKGCELLGYNEEEIIGKNWFDHFLPQENIDIIRNVYSEALKDEKDLIEYFENSIITKKGELKTIAWYNSALRDEAGKIIRIVSSGTDITQQVITQKALKESEETLRLALSSSKQGIFDLNVQSGDAFVTDNYAAMMGYDPNTFVETNQKWLDRLHPNDYENTIKKYSEYIAGNTPEYRVEFRMKTRQGKWKWILSLGSIVEYTKDKKPLRMLGTHTDIDEIKNTQRALKLSEEKYRALYDNAPLGYQSLDTNGDLLDVNPTWTNILGFDKKEVIGKNFGDFLHPSQVPLFKERFPIFKAAGNVRDLQFKMVKKDGTNIDVSYEGCAGYTPDGKFKQTYCTFKEITEEVKAKKALLKAKDAAERSEHYSKTIAKLSKEIINSELSLDMIAKLTYDNSLSLTGSEFGFVTSIDSETGDNIGHTLSEMMKDMCNVENSSIIFPKGPGGYPALWGHALNTHKGFFTNQPNKHSKSQGLPKGHIALENFLSVPVLIKTKLVGQIALANKKGGFTEEDLKIVEEIGNLYGLAIYRKHTEKELISAKDKAEESDKLKSAFLANMSHEIRTPMNGIMGFAELLKEPDITLDERDRFLGIIQKSGHRMLSIINDLIDISKIEAQQMEVFYENTEINTQIEYLHTFFKPEAEKKNIELIYNTTLSGKEAVIFSDREKIYAILTNLIKNAIKYTKKGKIEFGYVKIENHLEFYVKDTGIGIQHSKLDSIFDRFVQADLSNATEYEGAGLGLAITKAYIELLGGNIWLESEIDKGSTFTFTLPTKPID